MKYSKERRSVPCLQDMKALSQLAGRASNKGISVREILVEGVGTKTSPPLIRSN